MYLFIIREIRVNNYKRTKTKFRVSVFSDPHTSTFRSPLTYSSFALISPDVCFVIPLIMWLKRRVLPDLMLYVSFVFLVRFWKPWPGMTSSWYRPAADWAPAQSSSLRTCRSSSAPCVERDWSTSIGESPITGRWANMCCLNAESYQGRKNGRPRCTMLLTTVVCWCCRFEKLFFAWPLEGCCWESSTRTTSI